MPTIKISDQLGLNLDAQLGSASAWVAYARGAADMLLGGTTVSQIESLKLSDPGIQSFGAGLTFKQPVSLGTGGPKLTIGSDAGFHFRIVRRTKDSAQLLPQDELGDNLEIPAGTCYAALGFTANVNAGVTTGTQLTFGVTAGGGITIDSYRPFPLGDDGPAVIEALRQSIGEFVVPASPEDLTALPPGVVVTVKGNGKLKFSAKANLLAITNPLATATLPSPLPALSLNQAASVDVGASWEIDSEYQVRAHKLTADKVRLAWYRKRDSDFEVSVSASTGINTKVAGSDLFPQIIKAISADSKADLSAMPEDQRHETEKAVSDAVNRNLEVALEAELGELRSDEAMFLYDVECAALDAAAKSALIAALAGDLSEIASMPGITELRSIRTKMRETRFALKVNLLGIFNYGSVSRLALESKVTFTPSTGDLVILDKASASRIQSAASNFGPDEDKLRALMAESFLITAAYRGSKMVLAPPELKSSHMFFRLDANTSLDDARGAAAIAGALGLRGPDLPQGVQDFGRTCVLAEAHYDDALSHALFLHPDGTARTHVEYETAGRRAFELLILPDGEDRFRLRPMTDNAIWEQMKRLGPANFRQLFPEAQAPVIAADYVAIQWWADTMSRTGGLLARIGAEPQLREQLARDFREVADKAHEQFGKPWGLVAMFLAGGGTAPAEVRITGKQLSFAAGPALSAGL